MSDTVVVPLDGSRRAATALGPARALARRTGATMVLFRVYWDENPNKVQQYLDAEAIRLGDQEVATTKIKGGLVAHTILEEAVKPGAVICMATHGRGGIGQTLLGSIAQAVLVESNRPLFLVGPSVETGAWESEQWLATGNAIVTIDGSEASEAIVPVATEWARQLGLRVWVVQVLEDAAHSADPGKEPGAESAALRRVAAAIRDGGPEPQWELLRGDPVADTLIDYIDRLPASLIALTTHGRTGLARVALGSVAAKVVRESRCPVLVIRPRLAED